MVDDFLYYLAEYKYRMYNELHKFNPQAYRSEECYMRIKTIAKYEQLLDVINMLPNADAKELIKIEQEYFSDAPYVIKSK